MKNMKVTVIGRLEELVKFSCEVVALEKEQVSTICLVLHAVQRDTFDLPEIRILSYSFREVRQLVAHSHFNVSSDFPNPGFHLKLRFAMKGERAAGIMDKKRELFCIWIAFDLAI